MLNKKLMKGITVASTLLLITGCGSNPLTNDLQPNNVSSGQFTDALKFTKVSEQNMAEFSTLISNTNLNNTGVNSSNSVVATDIAPNAPTATPVSMSDSAMVSSQAKGGVMASPVSSFPSPGIFEEYVVLSFEEARTPGFSGTYLDALTKIVKPVIKTLGSDARLTFSSGNTDIEGTNKVLEQQASASDAKMPIYRPYYNWQFNFVSSSKKEVYSINISSKETLVLKQKWGLKDLSPDSIKIDSNKAIKAVVDAIKDKNFQSPEQNVNYVSSNSEILYEIPANSSWYLHLEQEKSGLVWGINMNIDYSIKPIVLPMNSVAENKESPDSPNQVTDSANKPNPTLITEVSYSGAYARVDAVTGKILSLSRPMKYTYTRKMYEPPMPVPMPAAAGKPVAVQVGTAGQAQL